MRTISLLVLTLIFSCTKEPVDRVPYYQFNSDDDPVLFEIPLDSDGAIKFKNQDEAVLTYTLVTNKVEKLDHSIGSFWGSSTTTLNYYDKQTIEFDSNDYALFYPALSLELRKISDDSLKGGFNFHKWNGEFWEFYSIDDVSISSMTIDGVFYEKVVMIDSENDLEMSGGEIPVNVNKVFIDLKKGLIGFDDVSNSQWRLVKTR